MSIRQQLHRHSRASSHPRQTTLIALSVPPPPPRPRHLPVAVNTILPSLFMERSVFYRERAAHYYKAVPYALAVLLRDL